MVIAQRSDAAGSEDERGTRASTPKRESSPRMREPQTTLGFSEWAILGSNQ